MELPPRKIRFSMLLSIFRIPHWSIKIYNRFFPSVLFYLRTMRKFVSTTWEVPDGKACCLEACPLEKQSDEEICMEELSTVMDRLGILEYFQKDEENWSNTVSVKEFAALFDEEPSLLEIQGVFEVFDENKDGYIDATELQRILCGLCLKEGSELEECKRMVCAFDENGDGLIDFKEFVTFMEKL